MNKLIEIGKELGRLILSATIGFLSTELVINTLVEVFLGTELDPKMKYLLTGFIGSLIRRIDRDVHLNEKDPRTGLFGF